MLRRPAGLYRMRKGVIFALGQSFSQLLFPQPRASFASGCFRNHAMYLDLVLTTKNFPPAIEGLRKSWLLPKVVRYVTISFFTEIHVTKRSTSIFVRNVAICIKFCMQSIYHLFICKGELVPQSLNLFEL